MRFLSTISAILCFSLCMEAQQIKTPAASPRISITQTVGLSEISLDYSRPSVKGRTIFGAGGLVPNGELWRTGANASTKIGFEEDVTIDGKTVPAGKYALYTIPNDNEWTIILHKNLEHWGTGNENYKASEDLMRFKAKPMKSDCFVETLHIGIHSIKSEQANLRISWENTIVEFPIMIDVDKRVMNMIESAMSGTSRGDYYTAARYYYDHDKDLSQALSWIKRANEMDAKFWQLRLQSEIEAKLGDFKTAIKTATTAKAAAKAANNMDYVRINDKNIGEWSKK